MRIASLSEEQEAGSGAELGSSMQTFFANVSKMVEDLKDVQVVQICS
jgi:biotin operon repressor